MEKNMILEANLAHYNLGKETVKTISKKVELMKKPIKMLQGYYSMVLEREVSMRQTLLLVNAQAAFACAVLPFECPMLLRAACCGWFLHAVLKCRDNF